LLVDIRPQAQREREGGVPAALVIESQRARVALRPTSDARLPQAVGDDVEWVVLARRLYLQPGRRVAGRPRLHRATDVIGGYHALKAEGIC